MGGLCNLKSKQESLLSSLSAILKSKYASLNNFFIFYLCHNFETKAEKKEENDF